ncbi:hypothetical protein SESBI_42612 [Sesbania bispinosa]|nr:hypothetical protein SESBI_42612 [Sesbania bispinosa]
MGEALFDLEQVLRSKQEILTPQEADILLSCKSKATRNLTASALAGGTVVWTATRKFSNPFRINLSADNSPFDCILVENEFENFKDCDVPSSKDCDDIIVPNNEDSEAIGTGGNKKQSGKKHIDFVYSRKKKAQEDESKGHPLHYQESEEPQDFSRGVFKMKAIPEVMSEVDPLDCLFGYGAPVEEIHHPDTSNKPSGTHNRGHRRSHRRRRMRNQEDLSNSQHAAPV